MKEHLRVFDAIVDGKPKAAAKALREHLQSSRPKVTARLETFRGIFKPPAVAYIT
jgi:DNA-binding GntR family transcriptional regulator